MNFLEVKRARTDTPPASTDYPEDLSWLRERVAKMRKPFGLAVPSWTVYVNKKRVAHFQGTQAWNDKILPEIRKIVNDTCPL